MNEISVRPGRPVWLEMNAQRVTIAMRFYEELFAWTSSPLHVPPWGSIPNIVNGERMFGNQFMAMGGFATPLWLIRFSADIERAEAVIKKMGDDVGQGIHELGTLGRILNGADPHGHSLSLIELTEAPPETDLCGDPTTAEFWGPDTDELARFYAEVFGLEAEITATGAVLRDDGAPRLHLRKVDFDIHPPRWIPYFRSTSVGGDCERARRAGGIVQIYQDIVPDIGELVILSDPAGAFFGLVDPTKA